MSQAKRTKKTEENNNFFNGLLKHLTSQYNISEDIIMSSLEKDKIEYKFPKYHITGFQEIDDEIEATRFNYKSEKVTIEIIKEGINKLIEDLEEKEEPNKPLNMKQNKNNDKKEHINYLQKNSSDSKRAPSKKKKFLQLRII